MKKEEASIEQQIVGVLDMMAKRIEALEKANPSPEAQDQAARAQLSELELLAAEHMGMTPAQYLKAKRRD